jgi:hypothetical protein
VGNKTRTEQSRGGMPGRLKINTDAAFSVESKQGATSCVIRDHRGAFYAAQAKWYERGYDACPMEAMACRDSAECGDGK